jgi:hypothetical protein
MNYLKEYQDNYKTKIDIYQNYSDTFDNIKTIISKELNINLDKYQYDYNERTTNSGYKMGYHRDNYMLRKFNKQYIFIPFDKNKLPIYTLLWYNECDCKGGSIEFLSNIIYKPVKNMFIFFDSNEIHRVNEQLSGKRCVLIYKFYK